MADFSSWASTMAFIAGIVPPVVAQPPSYPFVGKKQVKAALETNGDLQVAVCALMYHLQTAHEQSARDTKDRNKAGFMSSDAWHGCRIGEKLALGEELSPEERSWTARCTKYAEQLSVQLRLVAMAADPKLARYASVFSIPEFSGTTPVIDRSGWAAAPAAPAPAAKAEDPEMAEFLAWKAARAAKAPASVEAPAPVEAGESEFSFD